MHVTGLTHDERGYPVMEVWAQEQMTDRIVGKIKNNLDEILDYDTVFMEDAEVAVVAYGISARSARGAVLAAREAGLKVGLIKLNVAWPFPENYIRELSRRVKAMIMPEINLGQMVLELERLSQGRCQVRLVSHPGGGIITPGRIMDAVQAVLKEAA
jgi:2-oxoglutarate ferredoxin oxidoreductase subunit alpha